MKLAMGITLAIPAFLIAGALQAADAPVVVTSIKPIHSLVSAIMDGVGKPELIVDGAASPHTYNLKPSNARALQEAKVIFWVGPGLEAFLAFDAQPDQRRTSTARTAPRAAKRG